MRVWASFKKKIVRRWAGALLALVVAFFCGPFSLRADSLYSDDAAELESSARYNYYIGQYYYTQGRFNDAEQYFSRSRDMIERRKSVLSGAKSDLMPVQESISGGTGLEYIVGEGDVLYVSVWQNEDLNQEVIVRPDGKISFPLIGDVPARGLTITQIDEQMTVRLKEFVRSPEISISIRKLGGSKVIILGQVRSPGVYAVSGNKTVLEAIALAGGFTNDAVANSVILIRGGFQNPKAQRLNLKKLMRGKNFEDNVALQSEDIVFVPKTFIADLSYILNQIIDPVSRGAFAAEVMRFW